MVVRHGKVWTILATCVAAAATAGCPQAETEHTPVATTKPADGGAGPAASRPAGATDIPSQTPNRVEVRIRSLADPQRGWLAVEGIRESAVGAWATGSFVADRNKIVIETENVAQFTIDVSRIGINWNRRVVLRIDGRSSELTRKRHPVIHLRRSPAGSWDVVER